MEPIELIMKIWGIDETSRNKLEQVLQTTSPQHLGLSLMNLAACSDEADAEANDFWMETYLPELKFI